MSLIRTVLSLIVFGSGVIPESAALAVAGAVTVVLATYLARRKRRDGRLWDRRRSPRRRGYC